MDTEAIDKAIREAVKLQEIYKQNKTVANLEAVNNALKRASSLIEGGI